MDIVREDLLPRENSSAKEAMIRCQRQVQAVASFTGDVDEADIVIGVDQAFTDTAVFSCAVAVRGGEVVETTTGSASLTTPYIPGLLSFREGPSIVDALTSLSVTPDVVLFDGSGRIHYREAGIATHMGVVFDIPCVGVAKSLLCGSAEKTEGLSTGQRRPVRAGQRVRTCDDGTIIGNVLQTKQYSGDRHVNPLYVSSGHHVGLGRACDLVEDECEGYKLPEPIRLADRYVADMKDK